MFLNIHQKKIMSFYKILKFVNQDNSLQCGLYFEFLRYLFQTCPGQYEIYNLLNILKIKMKMILKKIICQYQSIKLEICHLIKLNFVIQIL